MSESRERGPFNIEVKSLRLYNPRKKSFGETRKLFEKKAFLEKRECLKRELSKK
jgi:hypothetical protein